MQTDNNNSNIKRYIEPQCRKIESGFSSWSRFGYNCQAQPSCTNCGGGCLELKLNKLTGLYHTRSNLNKCENLSKESLDPIIPVNKSDE